MLFVKRTIKKLKKDNNLPKLGKLLTHKDIFIRKETTMALLDIILSPATGNEYWQKYEIAKLFRNVNDTEILDILLESYKGSGHKGGKPLINSILWAKGFNRLLELLIANRKPDLFGNYPRIDTELSLQLLDYATINKLGIETFIKIIPYAKTQGGCSAYSEALEYFKTLPAIKLPKEHVNEIKRMIELSIKENYQDFNCIVSGLGRMDEIMFSKIISE
jgi:hypothetical protein